MSEKNNSKAMVIGTGFISDCNGLGYSDTCFQMCLLTVVLTA